MSRLFLAALALFVATSSHAELNAAPPAQKFCPVMTQDEIDPKESVTVTYQGV
jgi:hypothetical protein